MNIVRYRKKPIEIEAVKLTASNMDQAEEWCRGSIRGVLLPPEDRCIEIQTLEGDMRAEVGDWIIRGVKGEFYPCKPDIFATTYEDASTPSAADQRLAEQAARIKGLEEDREDLAKGQEDLRIHTVAIRNALTGGVEQPGVDTIDIAKALARRVAGLEEAMKKIVEEADDPQGCYIDGNEMGNIARAALAAKEVGDAAERREDIASLEAAIKVLKQAQPCPTSLSELNDELLSLQRNPKKAGRNMVEDRIAELIRLIASLTPPAGESVGEQMRARGWDEQASTVHMYGGWKKMIGVRLYMIVEWSATDFEAQVTWPGSRNPSWMSRSVTISKHSNELAAADACERHAEKEQGK